MIRLFRYLLGYVEFCFSGGFIEGFLNTCFKNNINISNAQRIDDVLVGYVNVKNYKKLHSIARAQGGTVKIIKKRGPIFTFLKVKNRYGLMAGFVVFLFIINFLSGFVWNVEITGNSKIASNEIQNVLKDNGLIIGAHWSSIKRPNIENYILSTFDDCSWAQINRHGTTAVVEIKEAVPKPEIDEERTPTNLKAKKSGIIVKAYTHGGWKVRNVGDSVRAGDLLVSGVYESERNKTNVYAHGSGEYIAKVREEISIVVNRNQKSKNYGRTKKYKKVVLFNIKLPLYVGKINYNSCDVDRTENFLKINDKTLPIGIVTQSLTPYTPSEISLNDSELTTLMNTEIEKKIGTDFAQYEIVSRDIDISLNENDAVATGFVDCLEDIGEVVKITKEDNILCYENLDITN